MTADAHATLVDRAEQAVLGAVLSRPEVFQQVGYLDPSQFPTSTCAALFGAIRTVLAQEPNLSSSDLATGLRAVAGDADIETLVDACPNPDGAAAYARMLVEAEFARTMASHADRLWHDAEPESPQRVEAFVLDQLAPQVSVEAEDAAVPGSWKGSRPNREEHILADLIQNPGQFNRLPATLSPESFSSDARSRLYEALSDISSRGEPVDKLTVAWELDRLQRDNLDADVGVDPVGYVDRLAVLPVEPGSSIQLAEGLAASARRATERAQATERLAQPGHGLGAQDRAIGRELGRHRTQGTEYQPSTHHPPSPGIEHRGHGPRLG